MHELAIAESVVSSVLERTGDAQVSAVHLRVGRLSGVVPDALSFCFELATVGTRLEGASLDVVEEPARLHCRSCLSDSTILDTILLCDCGSADVEVRAGRELLVTAVEVT